MKCFAFLTDVANTHSCSSQREEMKLGHEDDVVSQEHLCCDCSYCHRYAVAFILARLWLLLQQHDIEVADVVSQIRGQ